MLVDALLAYAHFLAILSVAVTLALECSLLYLDPQDGLAFRRLLRVDLAYFGAAIATLLTGGLRLAFGLKGWAFYSTNPVLYLKLGLFLTIGLISIIPTMRYIAWVKSSHTDPDFLPLPAELDRVRKAVWSELGLLALLPLLATLLARGIAP